MAKGVSLSHGDKLRKLAHLGHNKADATGRIMRALRQVLPAVCGRFRETIKEA